MIWPVSTVPQPSRTIGCDRPETDGGVPGFSVEQNMHSPRTCYRSSVNSTTLMRYMTPAEIAINSLAQGFTSLPDGETWFASLDSSERHKILKDLHYWIFQAHPKPEEVEVAIKMSGIKPSMTPCVVLTKWRTNPARGAEAVAALPESEHMKAFKVLLALFSVADERRRNTQCRDGCTHDWHNLANQDALKRVS